MVQQSNLGGVRRLRPTAAAWCFAFIGVIRGQPVWVLCLLRLLWLSLLTHLEPDQLALAEHEGESAGRGSVAADDGEVRDRIAGGLAEYIEQFYKRPVAQEFSFKRRVLRG